MFMLNPTLMIAVPGWLTSEVKIISLNVPTFTKKNLNCLKSWISTEKAKEY